MTPTPCQSELINPGFESGLTGWNSFYAAGRSQGGPKTDPDVHIPTPPNHEGSHRSGTSYGGAGDDAGGGLYQELCGVPGWQYDVSFWGTITANPGDDRLELYWIEGAGVDFSAGLPAGAQLLDSTVSDTNVWTQLSGTFVPASPMITLVVYWEFGGTELAINACHVDDWHITGAPPNEPAWKLY